MNKRTVLAAVEAPLVPENETNPGKKWHFNILLVHETQVQL